MGRLALAWRVLTNGDFAAKIVSLLDSPATLPAPVASVAASDQGPKAKPAELEKPKRNDAVGLLAALQREGRLIDFLKEPIESYADAQVGAAVRDIHRDCAAVLERQFAIRPVLEQAEGSSVVLGSKSLAGRIKLSGKVGDSTPDSGTLVHHGWQATKCDVPVWTGESDTAFIVAPAEVEVR
jgi:hypothetical protein